MNEVADILTRQMLGGFGGNGGGRARMIPVPPPGPDIFGPVTPTVAWPDHQRLINDTWGLGYRAGWTAASGAGGAVDPWSYLVPVVIIMTIGAILRGVFGGRS